MKIAILVPSRERMNRRLTLITSILTTVSDINNVNIYIGVDNDDPTRDMIYKISQAIPCVKIVDLHNEGKFTGLGKMWNVCVAKSTEEIISMIGDDMVFKTPNWDLEIIKEFTEDCPADQIKAVHCNDDHHKHKLAVNLFCHRKFVDVMGQFMREEFRINWVDQWLHQLFNCFNRLTYRDDILIEHRHWLYGKNTRDGVAERMAHADMLISSDQLWHDLVHERIKDVKKLQQYIGVKPDWTKVDTEGGVI